MTIIGWSDAGFLFEDAREVRDIFIATLKCDECHFGLFIFF